jgi:hypothetical protein
MVYTQTGALATGTGAIPQDDTIPQITEGTEFMTRTITPKHASNLLQIDVVLYCGQSADTTTQMALFVGTTANALAAVATDAYSTRQEVPTLRHIVVAGATSELTFRVRASGSSGTISFNGQGGGRRFGGVAGSSITITEYSV